MTLKLRVCSGVRAGGIPLPCLSHSGPFLSADDIARGHVTFSQFQVEAFPA